MPTERKAGPMAGFFKFTEIGQVAVGVVKRHFSGDNGHSFVLSPAIIKESATAQPQLYTAAAIGLSTDMLQKVDTRADVGKILSFQFSGTEPSSKGSPRKIFKVLDCSAGELDRMAHGATNMGKPYEQQVTQRNVADAIDIPQDETQDEDDQLPF